MYLDIVLSAQYYVIVLEIGTLITSGDIQAKSVKSISVFCEQIGLLLLSLSNNSPTWYELDFTHDISRFRTSSSSNEEPP